MSFILMFLKKLYFRILWLEFPVQKTASSLFIFFFFFFFIGESIKHPLLINHIQMTSTIRKHCACPGTLTSPPIYLTKYDHYFLSMKIRKGPYGFLVRRRPSGTCTVVTMLVICATSLVGQNILSI